jgi:predicted component of type VI protein secretion system
LVVRRRYVETSEAIQRLQNLGFDDHASDLRVATGAKRILDASFVRVQRNSILECLEVINRAANGQVPSEQVGPRQNARVIADAQYWVSNIVSQGLHVLAALRASSPSDALLHDTLLAAVTAVADAWSHVLAGDIDDLSKELDWSRA